MPIDASIYGNIKPVEAPSPMDAVQKAMQLSTMGMQQVQMQRQFQMQNAVRQAYQDNTDANGSVNRAGIVSQLSRMGLGQLAQDTSMGFAQQDKAQAEARSAQADAEKKATEIALPMLEHLDSVADDQKPIAYHNVMSQAAAAGLPMQNVPPEFSQAWLDNAMAQIKKTPAYLAQQAQLAGIGETQAKTAEAWANAGMAPLKRAGEAFGRSSPNATISNQYSDDPAVKSAKTSQVAMNQMLDSFRYPSPYSDESMALNALKIKFPGAPDVGSLEEFKKAQGATDAMKNWVSKKLQGIKALGAREDLMRDAISTYLPNVASLRGAQRKYYQKAINQGVPNAADIVSEPGIDQTEAETRALSSKLGPYVLPTQRGIMGGVRQMMGMGGNEADASDKPASPAHPPGAIVMIKGKFYRVGADGQSLTPNKGKQ